MPSTSRDLEQYADHLQRIAIKLEKQLLKLEVIRARLADYNEFTKPPQ